METCVEDGACVLHVTLTRIVPVETIGIVLPMSMTIDFILVELVDCDLL